MMFSESENVTFGYSSMKSETESEAFDASRTQQSQLHLRHVGTSHLTAPPSRSSLQSAMSGTASLGSNATPKAMTRAETSKSRPGPPGKLSSTDSFATVPPAVRNAGVKLSIYANWIKSEIEIESNCIELPFTALLLLSFMVLVILHLQQPQVHIVETAISTDIAENANFAFAHYFGHKGIIDVNSYADFWSWIRLGLVPLVFQTSWGYSEALHEAVPQKPGLPAYDVDALPSHRAFPGSPSYEAPIRNDYLRYNRIIGGMRFRQQTAAYGADLCRFPGDYNRFSRWLNKPCSPTIVGELPPDNLKAEFFENPKRIEWMLSEWEPFDKMIQRVIDMEDGCVSATAQGRQCLCTSCQDHPWLDELTTRIEITFIVYNPQYGLYSYVSVNFWFNRGGHILKLINIRSAWAGLYVKPIGELLCLILADLVWLGLVFNVFRTELSEIVALVRRRKKKKWYQTIADDYLGFWNVVDWVSVTFAVITVVHFSILTARTARVNDLLAEMANDSFAGRERSTQERFERIDHFFEITEQMCSSEKEFRDSLIYYPLTLMLRFFKSFSAQPRLAIVTNTFIAASGDLFHFSIVFFSVFICLTVNSILFFGQDSLSFSTLDRATHACFRTIFGDWDWADMEQIGRLKAMTWFGLFMMIMVLVLFNMLIAILMDAYNHVKSCAGQTPTVIEQVQTLHRRAGESRRKERVKLNHIWDKLLAENDHDDQKMLKNENIIYPSYLIEVVRSPRIKEKQATRTINNAQKDFDSKNTEEFTLDNMKESLDRLQERVESGVMCAAWMATKMEQYEEQQQKIEQAHRAHIETLNNNESDAIDDDEGLAAVEQVANERMQEVSSGVASILAGEMRSLERRQKEQQRAMSQMQSSLHGLRALVQKLNQTCTEVAQLAVRVAEEDGADEP